MSTGEITVSLFDGRRERFQPSSQVLVRAIDGQRAQRLARGKTNAFAFTELEIRDNFVDDYTVLVGVKDHSDAGLTPVRIRANQPANLELMMLRRDSSFEFAAFDEIERREALLALLAGDRPDAGSFYEDLKQNQKPALACLLNVATAVEQMSLVPGTTLDTPAPDIDANPLKSFKAIDETRPDRVFAWVDARFMTLVQVTAAQQGVSALSRFAKAPAVLHPGATNSFKQTDFGESNVQLSFHEHRSKDINGVPCMIVEADIDYFKDSGAHLLLEVFPNKLKKSIHGKESAEALTDPRTVYGLRWIAGRRIGLEFNPPYVLN